MKNDNRYFVRNEFKQIDGNTKYDDGGEKLGQCEGFEIKGPRIFMSGKLIWMLLLHYKDYSIEIHKYGTLYKNESGWKKPSRF